jgi:hypothetical protein
MAAGMQNKFADVIRDGVLNGETAGVIAKRINGGVINNVTVPGIMNVTRSQATALANTATSAVSTASRTQAFQNNLSVVKWIQQLSTMDDRTTDVCIAYSNAIWDAETLEPVGHKLPWAGGPPRHFNCRSVAIPVVKSPEELGVKTKAKISAEVRATMDGQAPADISFAEFLKKKSPEFRASLLGADRAKLFEQGKLSIRDMVDSSGRPLSAKKLKVLVKNNALPQTVRGTGFTQSSLDFKSKQLYGQKYDELSYTARKAVLKDLDLDRKALSGITEITTAGDLGTWAEAKILNDKGNLVKVFVSDANKSLEIRESGNGTYHVYINGTRATSVNFKRLEKAKVWGINRLEGTYGGGAKTNVPKIPKAATTKTTTGSVGVHTTGVEDILGKFDDDIIEVAKKRGPHKLKDQFFDATNAGNDNYLGAGMQRLKNELYDAMPNEKHVQRIRDFVENRKVQTVYVPSNFMARSVDERRDIRDKIDAWLRSDNILHEETRRFNPTDEFSYGDSAESWRRFNGVTSYGQRVVFTKTFRTDVSSYRSLGHPDATSNMIDNFIKTNVRESVKDIEKATDIWRPMANRKFTVNDVDRLNVVLGGEAELSTTIHELGHQIHFYGFDEVEFESLRTAAKKAATVAERAKLVHGASSSQFKDAEKLANSLNPFLNPVSRYAATNTYEWHAETFASYFFGREEMLKKCPAVVGDAKIKIKKY